MDTSTLESGSAFPRFHFPFSRHIVPAFVHLFGPNVDGPPEKKIKKRANKISCQLKTTKTKAGGKIKRKF